MKFEEAKLIRENNCAFICTDSPSSIWWINELDDNSHLKYSAAQYNGVDIPKYRTIFTENSMTSNGGVDIEYNKIIPNFNLNDIPLYEII